MIVGVVMAVDVSDQMYANVLLVGRASNAKRTSMNVRTNPAINRASTLRDRLLAHVDQDFISKKIGRVAKVKVSNKSSRGGWCSLQYVFTVIFADSNHVALETSELNGEDIDFDEIDHRLKKLERSLGPDNNHHIMNKHLDRLLNRVNQLEQYQYSNEIRLKAMEAQAKKADGLIEHLFRCRQYPNFCN